MTVNSFSLTSYIDVKSKLKAPCFQQIGKPYFTHHLPTPNNYSYSLSQKRPESFKARLSSQVVQDFVAGRKAKQTLFPIKS